MDTPFEYDIDNIGNNPAVASINLRHLSFQGYFLLSFSLGNKDLNTSLIIELNLRSETAQGSSKSGLT